MEGTASLLLSLCVAFANVQAEEELFPLAIVTAPTSKVVSSHVQRVMFFCTVKGEAMQWIVNGEDSSVQRNQRLMANGVEISNCPRKNGQLNNCTISFPASVEFNSTRLICATENVSMVIESAEVTLTIAGRPLAPRPELHVLSTTELQLSWEEPFTWQPFPILDYSITVHNTSDQTSTPYTVTEPGKLLTQEAEAMVCSELLIEVSARSEEGASPVGTVSGGFPVVPSGFPSTPNVSVRFLADGTPEVKVNIMTPNVCSFQKAYYQISVYRAGYSMEPEAVGKRQLIPNAENVVEAEIPGLDAYILYYAIVSYETMNKTISANITFSTAFQPTVPVTTDEDETEKPTEVTDDPTSSTEDDRTVSSSLRDNEDNPDRKHLVTVISSALAGCLLVVIIIVIIILTIFILLRRQLIMKSKEQRESRNAMVQNPLYEGPIYELISENKKRKSLIPKSNVHAEESVYLDSPTQSMPRDIVPPTTASELMVRVSSTEGKQTNIKLEGACGVDAPESSLDGHRLPEGPYATTLDTEDAYTIMCPVAPRANGAVPDHTNYQAASNGQSLCGQHLLGASVPCPRGNTPFISGSVPFINGSPPFTSDSSQKQVTLV